MSVGVHVVGDALNDLTQGLGLHCEVHNVTVVHHITVVKSHVDT